MPSFDSDRPDPQSQLPERLREAMVRRYEPAPAISPELDRAILREARMSYARRRRWWLAARWAGAGLAAAAAIALALRVFVTHPTAAPQATVAHQQFARSGDIDHNGRVDILDAYIVARAISRHEPLNPAWDVNGDGVVDQKDVELIARMAVQVTPEKAQ